MFFLRKKRQKRDLDAGLIFRWRGAKKHHTGKLVALLMAASFFVFSVYAIRIDGETETPASKRTGTVFMIDEDDPDCHQLLVQIEERSPFPRRWDPAYDADTMGRVSDEVRVLVGGVSHYDPQLIPLPTVEKELALPSIIEPNSALLGRALQTWAVVEQEPELHQGEVLVSAQITADERIQKRLQGTELTLPRALVAEEWYGQTYRFLVSIDETGVVSDCLSLSGESVESVKPSEKENLLAKWLRVQRFQSAPGQPVLRGVLELQIEAIPE